MKFLNTRLTILIVILALAAILRFWNLGNVPPSASMDEASIGFNAYSILKTGGDEYGELPILSHRAYDDYRRATYLYLVAPFIALFGLNAVAVRLPAVILSILTIFATYFLTLELFKKWEVRNGKFDKEVGGGKGSLNSHFNNPVSHVALLTSFLLAISPWHIYISRLGHESNAGLAFLVFGVLFFLQGEKNKNWVLILLSIFFFTLSMVSYYSGQAFIPLFVIGLFFLFRRKLLSMVLSDRKIIIAFFIFLILLIPILKEIFSPDALIRFQGTSTFKPDAHLEMYRQRVELWNKAVESNNFVGSILYSRHLFPFQVFIEGYVSHFDPKWLFTNSGAEPHKVPNMGLLYLWEIPVIVIGVVALIFSRVFDVRVKKLIFLWFFLAPLPAAIATQAPHAMRSYNFLPTWQIFSALGFWYLSKLTYRFLKNGTCIVLGMVVLGGVMHFLNQYFYTFPKEQSSSFQYALSKAVPYILENEKNYDKVVFSNKDNLYQSYMFFLFYSQYDPLLYQKQGGTKSGGFAETHKFGKFEFRQIAWGNEEKTGNILYVGNPSDFPPTVDVLRTIVYLNGEPGIKIVAGKQ